MNPKIAPNITQPDKFGYQVRVVSRGRELSRFYSFNQWGSKNKALSAAKSWRDQIKAITKKGSRRLINKPRNNTSGVLGVRFDDSFSNIKGKYQFSVNAHWTDYTGKGRNKTFYIGNEDTWTKGKEKKAFTAACAFRCAWEDASDKNKLESFDHTQFNGWQND